MIVLFLRTLDYSLGPQAAPAGGKGIPNAVFFVGFRKFAPTTERTRSKPKVMQPFPVCEIFFIHPKLLQAVLGNIADHMPFGESWFSMQEAGVCVHQRPAWTYIAGPGNAHRA